MAIIGNAHLNAASRIAHLVGLNLRQRKASSVKRSEARPRAAAPAVKPKPVPHPDDDPRAEMEGDGPLADARRRERARCEAIMRAAIGAGQLELGTALAFETTETARDAIALISRRSGSAEHSAIVGWRRASRSSAAHRSNGGSSGNSGWDRAFANAREARS